MRITQGLDRAVQNFGTRTATICGDRQRNWQEAAERVARLAGALQRLGLRPGDRAAILANNSDRYLEYYFAVPWAGGVSVPLNTRWAAPENIFALNDAGSRFLFVDADFAPMLAAFEGRLETVETVIYMGEGAAPAGCLDYEALIAEGPAAADAGRCDEDLAALYYTGGTTGRSKGVMLSHANIVYNALNVIATFRFDEETRWLHAGPMFHLADGSSTMGLTMAGGTHIFIPKFEPEASFRAIEQHRVNFCLFVPTMINLLVNHPKVTAHDLSSVRHVLYGASPMPVALLRRAAEVLKGWQFIQGYGMTELSPLATALDWKHHVFEGPASERLRSAGRAVCGVELKIVDENGKEVPRRAIGEVICRGDNVMMGYWNQPELTAEAVRGGWMHTGDAAWMDEEGFIYIVDRLKDMIISGGENIYSTEVEDAIYRYPAVAECAVIGVPSEEWGEQVHAIVVPKPETVLEAEDIIAHCHTLIANYKCPRSVEIRQEPLPLSGAGKILKSALRKPFWESEERQVH